MLNFDTNGFLQPKDRILCSLDEFRAEFVEKMGNASRKAHFERYLAYSSALKEILGTDRLKQWINGSFVTKVSEPKDIDFVTFVDVADDDRLGLALDDFRGMRSMKVYGVDAYFLITYPENHERRFFQTSDEAYWMELFLKSRRKDRSGSTIGKGFVELFY